MAWPLENVFLREVSKLFKCYVLVKKFGRKPTVSLQTLKIGFFNTLTRTKSRFWGAAGALKSVRIFLYV